MLLISKTIGQQSKKSLWGWLNIVFNLLDRDRLQQFGPDRVCAEWLLRNGAHIRWKHEDYFITDYNMLPSEGIRKSIEEVYVENASIMHYGFEHFKNCNCIKKVTFNNSNYINDQALERLVFLKKSLIDLKITKCSNITDYGLKHLIHLKNLQLLTLNELSYVQNKEETLSELKQGLKKCEIHFT